MASIGLGLHLFGCSYKSFRKKIPGKTIYRFPFSRPYILKRWVLNMRRKDWKPSHGSVLCSDHFKPECFDRTGQIVRLRQDAVPTIFTQHLQKVHIIKIGQERGQTCENSLNQLVFKMYHEFDFNKGLVEKLPFKFHQNCRSS